MISQPDRMPRQVRQSRHTLQVDAFSQVGPHSEPNPKSEHAVLDHAAMESLVDWLKGISGELSVLARKLDGIPASSAEQAGLPAPARRALDALEESIVNACSASRQVLSLLSPSALGRETLSPDQLWLILRSTLQVSGHRNLRLHWDSRNVEGWLQLNPATLLNALQELLRNAMEAMPDGGVLGIHLQECVLSATELTMLRRGVTTGIDPGSPNRSGKPGRAYLSLCVSDTGYGIPVELMERVLAGGYSTHHGRAGKGLERAREIILEHQGFLLLDSRVGSGTQVRVLLPLLDSAPGEQVLPQSSRVRTGQGRILLAEDDSGIRETTSEILERLGYTVVCARDGEDALERLSDSREAFDLVILDLVMPRLGGLETLKRLKERNRDQRALMVTGFMMDEDVDAIARIWGVPVIQKPFKLIDFSHRVAERISGPLPPQV